MIRLRDHRRAAAAGVILAAALLSAAVTVPVSAAEDPSPPGGLPGIQVPSLSWKDCPRSEGNGFQCATAQVPRDYRNPGSGSLSLNLKRHLATDFTHRIGSLFVNPGGPGGSAVGFVSAVVSRLPAEVASRFDVVGFDPRGVAGSGQVTCMTAEETQQEWAAVSASVAPGAFERGQRAAEQFNAACQTRSGDLLPYIGTEYVARDMDLLRAAVGDQKLNYFGVSFGTFIGTVYANLFPTRIRVMALDGAYDPEAYANNPYKYDYGQYVALEGALHRFLDWCARSPDCPFGHGDPAAAYDALVSDLDDNPVRDAHGEVVANGATLTYRVMFALNGGRPGWPGIAKDLSAAQQRGGSYVDSIGSKSNFFAANVSVECADRVYPPANCSCATVWRSRPPRRLGRARWSRTAHLATTTPTPTRASNGRPHEPAATPGRGTPTAQPPFSWSARLATRTPHTRTPSPLPSLWKTATYSPSPARVTPVLRTAPAHEPRRSRISST
ncbi:MAG: alpha/beta hydrolase [Actinomycetota bacterium]|nr:alpha/beta hydrolase [Actinomycetota bacterium]